jgi:hypothetical protein
VAGRFDAGTIGPGATVIVTKAVVNAFGDSDWMNAFMLAHPYSQVRLQSDLHSKRYQQATDGSYYWFYQVYVTNLGATSTNFAVDF